MIDIKFLRENPEAVKENIRKKFQDHKLPLVDEVIELDAEARKTQQEADNLRAERNKLSKQIGALMGQGKKEEAEEVKKQVAADAERLESLAEKEKELNEYNIENKKLYSRISNNKDTLKYIEKITDKIKDDENHYNVIGELSELANGNNVERITFERYVLAAYFD